jgi:hypothetical protein
MRASTDQHALTEVCMLTGALSAEVLPERLLPSEPGRLTPSQLALLWELFAAIGDTWSDGSWEPRRQRSHWLEFIEVRTLTEPSYLGEYRSAVLVLEELRQQHGPGMTRKRISSSSRAPAGGPIGRSRTTISNRTIARPKRCSAPRAKTRTAGIAARAIFPSHRSNTRPPMGR